MQKDPCPHKDDEEPPSSCPSPAEGLLTEPLPACLWRTLLLCCLLWVPAPQLRDGSSVTSPRGTQGTCVGVHALVCACTSVCVPGSYSTCASCLCRTKKLRTAPGLGASSSTELSVMLQKLPAQRLHCFLVPASYHPRREA